MRQTVHAKISIMRGDVLPLDVLSKHRSAATDHVLMWCILMRC